VRCSSFGPRDRFEGANSLPCARGRRGSSPAACVCASLIGCCRTSTSAHDIPEGLAVGVAFGDAAAGVPSTSLPAAIALALGIGIQNFPG